MASMANANKAALKEQLRRMEVMLNRPENRECFDCNCKGPRWASINLGIFICMRCAGVHRSLGTHITKVRSINMDVWEPAQIDFIERMGNGNAKLVYEARLPPSFRKPDLNADSKDVERILRDKWEMKRYYAPDADQKIKEIMEGRLTYVEEGAASPQGPPMSPVSLQSPQVASPTTLAPPTSPAVPAPVKMAPPPPSVVQAPPKQQEIDLLDFGAMQSAPPVNSGPSLGNDFFSGPVPGFQDSSRNNIMAAFDGPARAGPGGPQMGVAKGPMFPPGPGGFHGGFPPAGPGGFPPAGPGGFPPAGGFNTPGGFPPSGPGGFPPAGPGGFPPGGFNTPGGFPPSGPGGFPPAGGPPQQYPGGGFPPGPPQWGKAPQGPPPMNNAPFLQNGPPPIQQGGWR
eukprot:PhF_6_TR6226/c0_g1_i2/m.9400/K12486/SMAP; stromal membrane-associated protein